MTISKLVLPIVLLIFLGNSFAQDLINLNSPNTLIHPSNNSQTETFITTDPNNSNIVFGSCNTITLTPSFFMSEGIYVSTNNGLTWRGNDTCFGGLTTLHGGDPGISIDGNGNFILTHLGRSPLAGLFANYSTDRGNTWSALKNISTDDMERAVTATDAIVDSKFFGRTYTAWIKFAPPYPVYISYSDNAGDVWSTPSKVNNPTQRCSGGDISIDNRGRVYVVWAGVAGVSPFREQKIGLGISSDGGVTWDVKESAITISGIQGSLASKSGIRVNSSPKISLDKTEGRYANRMYIVTTEINNSPAGSDPDITLYRSDDLGNTWLPTVRVNKDALNNGKIQYFPAITVDGYGGVNIIYYDDRKTTSDSATVVLARSVDGGATFKEYKIANHNFAPSPIVGGSQGYQGDNISIAAASQYLIPSWMDNSTGLYQMYTSRISFSMVDAAEQRKPDVENDRQFSLGQNYPNPISNLHSTTKIGFTIEKEGFATLSVYTSTGEKIATIVEENLPAGKYSRTFTPSNNLPSGVYFYRLECSGKNITKAMVVIK